MIIQQALLMMMMMMKHIKEYIYIFFMRNFIKNIWLKSHQVGIYITPYLWLIYPNIIWLYLFIILSWYWNNNKCIITQFEYYLFGETFLGKRKNFFVPWQHRLILYINFLLIFYQRMN